jgi:hypothetical protein
VVSMDAAAIGADETITHRQRPRPTGYAVGLGRLPWYGHHHRLAARPHRPHHPRSAVPSPPFGPQPTSNKSWPESKTRGCSANAVAAATRSTTASKSSPDCGTSRHTASYGSTPS